MSTLFAVQALVPQSSLERLGTTATSIAEGDLNQRGTIWLEGIDVVADHPLLGIGSGAFRGAVASGKVAHNVYLSVLTETGIIGFILFGIILAIVVHEALHQSRWESRLWLSVLLVWALGASVHTWEQKKPTWLFLGLVVVSAALSVRRDASLLRPALAVPLTGSRNPPLVRGDAPSALKVPVGRDGQGKPGTAENWHV
jgi:hypothetical protein